MHRNINDMLMVGSSLVLKNYVVDPAAAFTSFAQLEK